MQTLWDGKYKFLGGAELEFYTEPSVPLQGWSLGPDRNLAEVKSVLSFRKEAPWSLTPLLNLEPVLSLFAPGCARGPWQSFVKAPISESWLLSPVKKSITLQ